MKKGDTAELQSFEFSKWEIKAETDQIHLIIIYRTPYSEAHPITTSVFLEEFSTSLESAVFCTNHLLITGDFNIHMDVADDPDATRMRALLESIGLKQHVNIPTHLSSHTLDLVITRLSNHLGISTPWADYLFSDHMPVYCKLQVPKPVFKRSKITFRKIKSIDRGVLLEELSRTDLCTNLHSYDLDGLVNEYNNTLKVALDRHAPIITKTVTKRPSVPWFNDEVKSAKKEKRRAERKWHRTKLHSDFIDFKTKKNIATCVMKRARTTYYTDFIQGNSDDSRKLFKCAKLLFNQEVDLTFPGYNDKTKLANDIEKFFAQKIECIRTALDTAASNLCPTVTEPLYTSCPTQLTSFTELSEEDIKGLIGRSSKKTCSLDPMPTSLVVESLDVLLPVITRMLNLSLQNGNFPDTWKLADVRPRPKMAAEALFANLRPISNLQFASKLTERAVFCAAFDTVDHTILLDRLSSDFGISGQAYSWFDSYLRNRFQSISINGKTSTKFHTKYGVPQGSCLGPLLFVLYTSRLFKIIEHHLPDVHTYADDTQLYVSFIADSGFEQSAALEAMQSCIVDIRKWKLQDRLKLNDDKTEFIVIGTRQQLAKVNVDSLQVGESIVTAASIVRNLGCWFDDQLKMDTYINNICRSAFFHLYNIRRITKYLSSDCAQTLVNA